MKLLLALAITAVVLPAPALACTCAPRPEVPEAVDRASRVFHGTVISIEDAEPFHQRVTFEVSEHFKGAPASIIEVSSAASTAACGFPFQQGAAYVVYARGDEQSLTTGTCSRTMVAAPGSDLDVLRVR